jgi:hypothetical protein
MFALRLRILVALVFAFPCGRLLAAPSATQLYIDPEVPVLISVAPIAERWNGEGFMPVRVRIENRAKEALAWNFNFSVRFGYIGANLEQEIRLGAAAGEVVETVVFVSGYVPSSHARQVTIGVNFRGPGELSNGVQLLRADNAKRIVTAVSAALEGPLITIINSASGVPTEINEVDAALWPADWRVWSPFDRVVLQEREYAALDAARRAALDDWVALGGTLDLYPAAADMLTREPLNRHGLGVIRIMPRPILVEVAAVNAGSAKIEATPVRRSLEDMPTARGLGPTVERRAELQPKRGALGISLFLVAFGILVGPINLFVFAPSGRRHRLFFTVPVISLGTSALLAAYIVVQDGFGGEGVRSGLVFLMPQTNQAVLTQTQVSRTGVLLGDGFALPEDVIMSHDNIPSEPASAFSRQSGNKPYTYARAAERASGDWFASRRTQEHTLRRLIPTRARVELIGGGTGKEPPVVQSSVGAVLREFVYRDAADVLWTAEEIAPGQRVTLRVAKSTKISSPPERGLFTARGGAAEGLAPLETLSSIRWDEREILYAGLLINTRTP